MQVDEDEIELVELEEEAPLLLNNHTIDIINVNYWHWQNSNASKKKSIETICIVPEMPTLLTLLKGDACHDVQQGIGRKEQDSVADMSALQENMNELRLEMEHAKVMDDPVKRLKMEALLQRVEEAIQYDTNLAYNENVIKETPRAADGDSDSDMKEHKAIEKLDEKVVDKTNAVKQSYHTTAIAGNDGDGIQKHKADIEKTKFHSLNEPTTQNMVLDAIRRTLVAITGGALTVAGVACIPCPIVPGCLVVYVGLMILATEFESAKIALDTVKEPIDRWLLAAHNDGDEDVSVGLLPEVSIMK